MPGAMRGGGRCRRLRSGILPVRFRCWLRLRWSGDQLNADSGEWAAGVVEEDALERAGLGGGLLREALGCGGGVRW